MRKLAAIRGVLIIIILRQYHMPITSSAEHSHALSIFLSWVPLQKYAGKDPRYRVDNRMVHQRRCPTARSRRSESGLMLSRMRPIPVPLADSFGSLPCSSIRTPCVIPIHDSAYRECASRNPRHSETCPTVVPIAISNVKTSRRILVSRSGQDCFNAD